MPIVTAEHIHRLIQLESEIRYNQSPDAGKEPFIVIDQDSPLIISAPHGARTYRNKPGEAWHEEDEYTAGMALLLGELTGAAVIVTNCRNDGDDPNNNSDAGKPYKQALGRLIEQHHVRFVIDLHGAGLQSGTLDPLQTIDLGLRLNSKNIYPSMALAHVYYLESLLKNTKGLTDPACFVVNRNKYPGYGNGTIITFASALTVTGSEKKVQAIQIEMRPQVRVAQRFPGATKYKAEGPYQARPENVIHMLQSLVDFSNYLQNQE